MCECLWIQNHLPSLPQQHTQISKTEGGKKLEEMTVLPKPTSAATPTFPICHTPSLFLPWTNR